MAINIPESAFAKFNEAVQLFMRTVTVVYPPKQEDCPNCVKQTFGGRSVNIYTPGGPIPFSTGMPCPYCGGAGVRLREVTENVEMRVYWDKKSFINMGIGVNIPDNSVQTIGYMSDYNKLIRANHIICYFQESEEKVKLSRSGEGYPTGFKQNPTQYVVILWERQ